MNPEAIEAAAKASWGGNWDEADDQWKAVYRQEARIHLGAAAPYLIREARAAELEAAAVPLPAAYRGWLRDRADAIRDGNQ